MRASAPRPPAPSAAQIQPLRAADLDVYEVVTGGADKSERLPLVVAVHGLGDDPRSFSSLLSGLSARARVAFPRGPEPYGSGYSWFAFRARSSESELAPALRKAADRLARSIDQVVRQRPTSGRPIVTGFSQGGMLSFALAAQHPSLVRAAFPVGGTLPESLVPAERVARPPLVVALHGERDELVPIAPARRAIGTLRERGYDARLEAFSGVGHSVPREMQHRLRTLVEQALSSEPPKGDR